MFLVLVRVQVGHSLTLDYPMQILTSERSCGITGGNFYIPAWGVLIDVSKTDGFVDVTWRGTVHVDKHFTTKACLPAGEERWGSSTQVANSLYRACMKGYNESLIETNDVWRGIQNRDLNKADDSEDSDSDHEREGLE